MRHVSDLDPRYVVLGCLTLDSVVGASGDLIRNACGGNALYGAVGAQTWGSGVGIVSRVGSGYPEACLSEIAAAVDIGGVSRLPGEHPIRVAFAYRSDGSRTRVIPPAAMATIPASVRGDFVDTTRSDAAYLRASPTEVDIPQSWLRSAVGFHLPALLEASLRELVVAIRKARPDARIIVDAPWFAKRDGTLARDLAWLSDVDVILPSEDDIVALHPGLPIVEAARDVARRSRHGAVVKLGSHGSIVVDAVGSITHVPAFPASLVDPTGAGDSFCGGFLVGLGETDDPVQAAEFGTVAASFVVEARTAIAVLSIGRRDAERRLGHVMAGIRPGIMTDVDWRKS